MDIASKKVVHRGNNFSEFFTFVNWCCACSDFADSAEQVMLNAAEVYDRLRSSEGELALAEATVYGTGSHDAVTLAT